ncbi:hypothetical protein [Streptomyces sp. 8L]|uniref:hypothetical protein n=1 Tax=Streptomyces sp. 8L TaxID=2877242 RepID=UPI001CD743B2|nr:hypothetical protein [Streptomyces sp. 8L]MCA1217737.1 hypothetical protein [Streptomyces sp. 8L]
MSVRTRSRRRSTGGAGGTAGSVGAVGAAGASRAYLRLPWWAVVLPATAFFALLTVVGSPSQAHAADGGDMLARLLREIQLVLFP